MCAFEKKPQSLREGTVEERRSGVRISIVQWVLPLMVAIVMLCKVAPFASATLTPDQVQKLNEYARATVRYFTSAEANNLEVGFPHTFFGTGKFQVYKDNQWQEEAWDLTRGYGSHVNINEVTLRFLSLAAAYIILSIFDALNPDEPLASYNVEAPDLALGVVSLRRESGLYGKEAHLTLEGTERLSLWLAMLRDLNA